MILNNLREIFLRITFNLNINLFYIIIKRISINLRGLGIGGLGIGDWGLGIGPNPQSPIPNPPIPNPLKVF
jgi:hypothetical protein